ncbi:hypothetical protein JOC24_000526 [Streptomyces sp. HB132]|nr:hypothetical protein [Streptomyces sp. HB132]
MPTASGSTAAAARPWSPGPRSSCPRAGRGGGPLSLHAAVCPRRSCLPYRPLTRRISPAPSRTRAKHRGGGGRGTPDERRRVAAVSPVLGRPSRRARNDMGAAPGNDPGPAPGNDPGPAPGNDPGPAPGPIVSGMVHRGNRIGSTDPEGDP